MKTNLLINNKSVQGNADAFDVINPFNSEIITSIAQSSTDQVNEAVSSAKHAFLNGRELPLGKDQDCY